MRPGFRGMAIRSAEAEERFLAYAEKHGDLTRQQAERALQAFRKAKVIRFDAVGGSFHVKHGGFLERAVLRRAAGLEETERDRDRAQRARRRR